MHKELEEKFRDRWPRWFRDLYGDYRLTCMAWGFAHDDGWFDLVWGLCEAIEALGPDEDFKVEQVKEKFGGLRFYVSGGNQAIWKLVWKASSQSHHICEVCGQPGTLRDHRRWIRTLCEHHAAHTPKFVPMGAADEMTGSIRALIQNQEKTEDFLNGQEKKYSQEKTRE
jgi:hypothetical protein